MAVITLHHTCCLFIIKTAYLVVFETTEATGFVVAPTAFDVVEVLGFEAVEAAALLAGATKNMEHKMSLQRKPKKL